MNQIKIALRVNGREVAGLVEPRTHLADFLREELLFTGTHLGCEQGVCGACTIMLDGKPARSCITLAAACDQADIQTIEGFEDDPLMARLRQAFSQHHGLQCGFCTPGMLATGYDIVRRLPDADVPRIRKELSGNLCRCTGYQGAVAAIADVLAHNPPTASLQPKPRTPPRVMASRDAASMPVAAKVRAGADLTVPDEITNGVTLNRCIAIQAEEDQVWRVLQDIPAVVSCIPGAQMEAPVGDDAIRGLVAVTIGPMRANFDGVASVHLNDVARSGRVIGRGKDRLSRSMLEGALDFKLDRTESGALQLMLDIVYKLQGPLAQFGRPEIVEEIADRLLAETASALVAKANGTEALYASRKALGGFSLILTAIKGLLKKFLRRG